MYIIVKVLHFSLIYSLQNKTGNEETSTIIANRSISYHLGLIEQKCMLCMPNFFVTKRLNCQKFSNGQNRPNRSWIMASTRKTLDYLILFVLYYAVVFCGTIFVLLASQLWPIATVQCLNCKEYGKNEPVDCRYIHCFWMGRHNGFRRKQTPFL